MVKLQVLICTIGVNGIKRVLESIYPVMDDVEYLVSWQQPDDDLPIPEELAQRSDIKVYISKNKGVCKNRNHAIACATAPICLMTDDDVNYTAEELMSLIEAFEQNPQADIITVKCNSIFRTKKYPDVSFNLSKSVKGYYVSCIEIAFRLSSVKNRVYFNENISIGTPVLRCGEEDVFIYDCKCLGFNMIFVPIVVGTHNNASTGTRDLCEPYFWMTKGAVFSYIYKYSWLPRIIVNAWRVARERDVSMFFLIKNAIMGVGYARKNKVFPTKIG